MKEEDIRPQQLFNRYLELSRQDVETFFSDQSGFIECACPACGSTQQAPGLEKLGFRYVLCGDCESLYVSPRPRLEAVHRYYREGAAVNFWSTDFFRVTAEARREKIFRPRAALVAEWTREAPCTEDSRRSFADIGSGYGIFLEEVSRLGVFDEVMGIEPAPGLAQICRERGFRVIEKLAEAVSPGEVRASFISSFELLEHLFDPHRFLQSVRGLLVPGGLLLYTTLTISGFDLQVLWEHSKSLYPPHHINLISVRGMQRLLARSGFELLELSTPGELDVDIVRNMIAEQPDLPLPRFVRHLVCHADATVRAEFQAFLRTNKLSSHLRVIARRPLTDPGVA